MFLHRLTRGEDGKLLPFVQPILHSLYLQFAFNGSSSFLVFHRYHRWYFDLAFAFSSIALLHCLDFILFFGFCFAV